MVIQLTSESQMMVYPAQVVEKIEMIIKRYGYSFMQFYVQS